MQLFKSVIFFIIVITSFQAKAQQKGNQNINFTSFDVVKNNNKVSINLVTDGKVPTNYFEIQKSTDGVNFKTIALIMGPDPKKSTCDCYGCFDKLSKDEETTLYRARHIGLDGSEQITEAKSIAKL